MRHNPEVALQNVRLYTGQRGYDQNDWQVLKLRRCRPGRVREAARW